MWNVVSDPYWVQLLVLFLALFTVVRWFFKLCDALRVFYARSKESAAQQIKDLAVHQSVDLHVGYANDTLPALPPLQGLEAAEAILRPESWGTGLLVQDVRLDRERRDLYAERVVAPITVWEDFEELYGDPDNWESRPPLLLEANGEVVQLNRFGLVAVGGSTRTGDMTITGSIIGRYADTVLCSPENDLKT